MFDKAYNVHSPSEGLWRCNKKSLDVQLMSCKSFPHCNISFLRYQFITYSLISWCLNVMPSRWDFFNVVSWWFRKALYIGLIIRCQILGTSLLGGYLLKVHLILFRVSIAKGDCICLTSSPYSVTIPYLDCIREFIYIAWISFWFLKKLYHGTYVNIFLFSLPDHKLALTPGFGT